MIAAFLSKSNFPFANSVSFIFISLTVGPGTSVGLNERDDSGSILILTHLCAEAKATSIFNGFLRTKLSRQKLMFHPACFVSSLHFFYLQ